MRGRSSRPNEPTLLIANSNGLRPLAASVVLLGFQGRLSALLRHERLDTPGFVLIPALHGCSCLSHENRSLDHALRPFCGTLAGSRGFVRLSHPDPSLPCILNVLPESGIRRDRARRRSAVTSTSLG